MAPVSPPRTTVELLRKVAAEHPDRAAFVETDRRLTFAEKMNSIPKVVVSSTLDRPEWNNSRVLAGDLGEAVAELKREEGGEILVNGSAQLARALGEHGLIDEYRLMVFPVVLGAGQRLFAEAGGERAMRLRQARQAGECLIVTYEPAQAGA